MQAQSKVYGPYEVIQEVGSDGKIIQTLPFSAVRGSQVIVSVDDNFAQRTPALATDAQYSATAEVSLNCIVQGYEFTAKRQQLRMLTGPMSFIIEDANAFDQLVIRARNMSGGRRGAWDPTVAGAPIAANGFSLKVLILLQPRSGMGPKKRFEGMG